MMRQWQHWPVSYEDEEEIVLVQRVKKKGSEC
jgi:hypothetical protein